MITTRRLHECREKLEKCFAKCFPGEPIPPMADDLIVAYVSDLGEWQSWIVAHQSGHVYFGGVLPGHRGNGTVHTAAMFEALALHGAKECQMLVKQANIPMQILALKSGLRISGVTTGKDGKVEIIFWRAL